MGTKSQWSKTAREKNQWLKQIAHHRIGEKACPYWACVAPKFIRACSNRKIKTTKMIRPFLFSTFS